jgi:large subunit ribosomal protein L20
MTRVKRGKISSKRRRNVLKQTKGYRWQRKSKERAAREALLHAGEHAFNDRRKKKRVYRKLWNTKINAAVRQLADQNLSYSKLIEQLKKENIALNRKVLSELAEFYPEVFSKVIEPQAK